jgi:hypothetical protein
MCGNGQRGIASGNYRLMRLFAAQLSEMAAAWRKAVSPYAEEAAKIFWQGRSKKSRITFLPTRLTQTRRSLAKSGNLVANVATVPKTNPRCPLCGAKLTTGSLYCAKCVPTVNRENLLNQAKLSRIATHNAIAEARRSVTQARQAQAFKHCGIGILLTCRRGSMKTSIDGRFCLGCPSSL